MRKTTAIKKYMMPIFLWSTVVTHSWSTPVQGGRSIVGAHSAVAIARKSQEPRTKNQIPNFQEPRSKSESWNLVLGNWFLLESQQVVNKRFHLPIAQAKCRHQTAWFGLLRINHPFPQLGLGIRNHSRCEGLPAHQVRQVWSVSAMGAGTAHPVAVDARLGQKHVSTRAGGAVIYGGFLLVIQQTLEVRGRIDNDPEEHVGVLRSTVFGALAQEQALLLRLKPHLIRASGNQVRLPGQAWHPETVANIRRFQCQINRPR